MPKSHTTIFCALFIGACCPGNQTSYSGALAPSASFRNSKVAISGVVQSIDFFYSVNPDCSSPGSPVVRLVTPPQNGQLTIGEDGGYPSFPKESQFYSCNTRKTPGVRVSYVSRAGYVGQDSAAIEVIYPGGAYKTGQYSITVK
jgi:hypothetical protein